MLRLESIRSWMILVLAAGVLWVSLPSAPVAQQSTTTEAAEKKSAEMVKVLEAYRAWVDAKKIADGKKKAWQRIQEDVWKGKATQSEADTAKEAWESANNLADDAKKTLDTAKDAYLDISIGWNVLKKLLDARETLGAAYMTFSGRIKDLEDVWVDVLKTESALAAALALSTARDSLQDAKDTLADVLAGRSSGRSSRDARAEVDAAKKVLDVARKAATVDLDPAKTAAGKADDALQTARTAANEAKDALSKAFEAVEKAEEAVRKTTEADDMPSSEGDKAASADKTVLSSGGGKAAPETGKMVPPSGG